MNLHLSGCTVGGGETQRRSVPRLLPQRLVCVCSCMCVCVLVRVCVCACSESTTEALVARGLLPHVSPYFMMSCCSREVGHGTCRENTPLHSSMLGGDGESCRVKGLGQEHLCTTLRLSPLGLRQLEEEHMGLETGGTSVYKY